MGERYATMLTTIYFVNYDHILNIDVYVLMSNW